MAPGAMVRRQKSHFLKEFVPERTRVDVPGSIFKQQEFGGQSPFAALRTGIIEPSTDTRACSPSRTRGLDAGPILDGMAPRVTPELALSRTWDPTFSNPGSALISPQRKPGWLPALPLGTSLSLRGVTRAQDSCSSLQDCPQHGTVTRACVTGGKRPGV